MRHLRFDVATLHVDHKPVVLKAAYLLVAQQDGSIDLQWECLAYGFESAETPRGGYQVEIVTLDGRSISGPVVLVRSLDGNHVLRGDGPIVGVTADELS